jgi:hypothetical protein
MKLNTHMCLFFSFNVGISFIYNLLTLLLDSCLRQGFIISLQTELFITVLNKSSKELTECRISVKESQDTQNSYPDIYYTCTPVSRQQTITQKSKDRATRTPLKNRDEFRCPGMMSISCSTCGTCRVTLVAIPTISHEGGKDRICCIAEFISVF